MAVSPRSFLRTLRYYMHRLFPRNQRSLPVAGSVALGVFIGVLPTLGIALVLTALVQQLLKLPKAPGLVASFIAIPPTLFLFFYPLGYFAVGVPLVRPRALDIDFLAEVKSLTLVNAAEVIGSLWVTASDHVIAFMVGMLIVASISGAIAFAITYVVMERKRKLRLARRQRRRRQA